MSKKMIKRSLALSALMAFVITGSAMAASVDGMFTDGYTFNNVNEDLITSLRREVLEEVGYTIKNIKEIGKIDIEYCLLNRIDEGYFFYAEIDEYRGTSLEEYEKEIFDKVEWFSLSSIDELYSKEVLNVGKMIHKRDYFMINKLKELKYLD